MPDIPTGTVGEICAAVIALATLFNTLASIWLAKVANRTRAQGLANGSAIAAVSQQVADHAAFCELRDAPARQPA